MDSSKIKIIVAVVIFLIAGLVIAAQSGLFGGKTPPPAATAAPGDGGTNAPAVDPDSGNDEAPSRMPANSAPQPI